MLFVVQDIEKLPWCYNKRFFRKVLDIPCDEISVVIALLKYHFVEWYIFHIRKSDAGRRWINKYAVFFNSGH